jgi:ABC-type transport system substrate-binding protein
MPFLRMSVDPTAATTSATFQPAWSGIGPFRPRERRPERVTYLANQKYFDKDRPRIKQIVEVAHASVEDRCRALQNGEIDLIDFVPPRNREYVAKLPGTKLVKMTAPRVHFLHFNHNRPELRNDSLRRAIAYGIDRAAICKRVGVKLDKQNRLLTGPIPYGSFGYNLSVKDWPHELILARALVVAVKKELKGLAPLTLAHQGNETTRMACEEIVKQLKAIGIDVNLVEIDERSPDPRYADLRYQTVVISEPTFDLITLLTRDNPGLFDNAAPRLRSLLVDLLQVPNATVASRLLPELHQALSDAVAVLPLWQWYDEFLVADNVTGLPEASPTVYSGVVDWNVTPRLPPARWITRNPDGAPASPKENRP